MPKNPSLAAPMQTFDRTPDATEDHEQRRKPIRPTMQSPSRRGKKALIGYFDPSVSLQLKRLALEENSSVQRLLGEALNLLFQARGKPKIAQ